VIDERTNERGYTAMSGRDPRTGRELSALYAGPTGNTLADVALQHSPATRILSSLRQLTDERKEPLVKAVDLLTGAKVTDLSGGVEHQKDLEARHVLQSLMHEMPHLRVTWNISPIQPRNRT
jgi:hypothetical protein